jgi:hypothetical protein
MAQLARFQFLFRSQAKCTKRRMMSSLSFAEADGVGFGFLAVYV